MTTIRSIEMRRQADLQRRAWREFCDREAVVHPYEAEPPKAPEPRLNPYEKGRLSVAESKAVLKLIAEGKL